MRKVAQNPRETENFAKDVLKKFSKRKYPLVIALVGELGAGKTTFVRAFAKALGVKKRILSPTFLIVKRFPVREGGFDNLYHIDAYRVSSSDLKKLGIKETLAGKNAVLVEWADKVRDILPKGTIWVRFKHGKNENERQITLNRR